MGIILIINLLKSIATAEHQITKTQWPDNNWSSYENFKSSFISIEIGCFDSLSMKMFVFHFRLLLYLHIQLLQESYQVLLVMAVYIRQPDQYKVSPEDIVLSSHLGQLVSSQVT